MTRQMVALDDKAVCIRKYNSKALKQKPLQIIEAAGFFKVVKSNNNNMV